MTYMDYDEENVTLNIYFVRHGKTSWNSILRFQGITNIPLSDEGKVMAEKAGKRLSQIKADMIISSPLTRAVDTATIITKFNSMKNVEIWPELREQAFGQWEGLTRAQIDDKFGEGTSTKWTHNQFSIFAKDGETLESLISRSESVKLRITECNAENIIVVSHGSFLRLLFLSLINQPVSAVFWKVMLDNCSITVVEADKSGNFIIKSINDTIHLNDNILMPELVPIQ